MSSYDKKILFIYYVYIYIFVFLTGCVKDTYFTASFYNYDGTLIHEEQFKENEIIIYNAFLFCDNLLEVKFEDNSKLETIKYGAFAYSKKLTKFTIPNSMICLESYVFQSCEGLEEVIISPYSKLTIISKSLFYNCYKLKSIYIPKGVTEIGSNAFTNCIDLIEIVFDEEINLETIKSYAFSSCSDLDKLFIPKSVGKIEKNVFNGCIGMTIYCEVLDKPTGWVENWSGYSANVIWNTSYQDFYK